MNQIINQAINFVPFLQLKAEEVIASSLSPHQAKQIRDYFHNQGLVVVYTQFHHEIEKIVVDEKQLQILGNDRKRYDIATNPKYKYRYLLGRALIKQTLGTCLDISPNQIDFHYGTYGKPFVTNAHQIIDFNLSHTQNIMVLAVTKLGQIGIDIESVNRSLETAGIAKTICTDFELQELHSLPTHLRNLFLVQLWTLKEAFSKSLGLGLNKSFSSFGFKRQGSQFYLLDLENKSNKANWSFISEIFLENYRLSLALNHHKLHFS